MSDQDEDGTGSTPLGERVRGALAGVRRHGADSLRGVRRSAAEASDRLKSTAAAERLESAVDGWRLIKKASAAQQRGNHPMAYRLLEPEVQAHPDDERLVAAFWKAAVACDRPADAVPAMQRIIRKLAVGGHAERAAELWLELHDVAPEARCDPGALVRIAPVLLAQGAAEPFEYALRDAVHPENGGLSPGMAVRVAELARESDPRTALCAAHRALAADDLDEAKRARLEDLVAELEASEASAAKAAAAKTAAAPPDVRPAEEPAAPEAAVTRAAVAAALHEPTAAANAGGLQVTEAMPTQLRGDAIALQLRGGRKVRISYSSIQALAAAEVLDSDLHPVVLIDLVLNWTESDDASLRVVRLRSDGFDPRMVMEAPTADDEALRDFLAELLARSSAEPLPDLDSVLGVKPRAFDDIETYEREVLRIKS